MRMSQRKTTKPHRKKKEHQKENRKEREQKAEQNLTRPKGRPHREGNLRSDQGRNHRETEKEHAKGTSSPADENQKYRRTTNKVRRCGTARDDRSPRNKAKEGNNLGRMRQEESGSAKKTPNGTPRKGSQLPDTKQHERTRRLKRQPQKRTDEKSGERTK